MGDSDTERAGEAVEAALVRRVRELEKELADLNGRLPAHSLKPALFAELERVEDELAEAREELREFREQAET